MKKLLISLIAFAFSFSSSASILTQCNTCSSESSYKNVASYLASAQSSAITDVFIVNFQTDTMKKYRVVSLKSREPGVPDIVQIVERIPTNSESSSFVNAADIRREITASPNEVPSSIANSAYQLAGASYILNNVSDYFIVSAGIATKATSYLSSLAVISGKVTNVPITVELNFADGSSGIFQLTPTIGASIGLKILQLKDADGNTIPLTAAGYKSGSYKFSDQAAFDQFTAAALRFGVRITSGSGGSYQTECVEVGSGHMICTIIPH
jgi:hypothetical protein